MIDVSGPSSWEEATRRFYVGQVVDGVVDDVRVYGVFCDIEGSFPAFIDRLDVPPEPLEVGQKLSLKVVQFADWNRQIRVAPAIPPLPASQSSD